MVRALGPERRTMPMPPRPGGVEMATMVSSNSGTDFLWYRDIFFSAGEVGVFTGGFAISTAQNDGFFVVLSVIFVVRTWFLTRGSEWLLARAEGCEGKTVRASARIPTRVHPTSKAGGDPD